MKSATQTLTGSFLLALMTATPTFAASATPIAPPVAADAPTVSAVRVEAMLQWSGVVAQLGDLEELDYAHPGILDAAPRAIEQILADEDDEPSSFSVTFGESAVDLVHKYRNFSDVIAGADVGTVEIEAKAREHLGRLGLDRFDLPELRVRQLMRASSDAPDAPQALAYKVFADLVIDGVPVEGPRVTLSYFLDGSLHKLRVRWPEMSMDSNSSRRPWTLQRILPRVQRELSQHPLAHISGPLDLAAAFMVREGRIVPVVSITGMLEGPDEARRWGVLNVALDS